jgi:mannose-6-phosphate isomerase-like protein (cupin superfamily)
MATAASTSDNDHELLCLDGDAAAIAQSLAAGEHPGRAADPAAEYLDLCIAKPWGRETRIYDDALSEAWLLDIEPGRCTSTHAHPRKTTLLICIAGSGRLTRGDGTDIQLAPGTVVRIGAGARHRSSTSAGMRLIEFESPRDKFDLIRFEDAGGRARTGYEGTEAARAHAVPGRELSPLVPAPAGPPLARLRTVCTEGWLHFGLESGAQLAASPEGLQVAIAVAIGPVLRHEFTVLNATTVGAAASAVTYLTVRSGRG